MVLRKLVRPALFAAALAPFAVLLWDGYTGGLGANPIEAITHRTGWWTLALLMVTLAVTPLRRLTGWNGVVKYRRMLGLFAFFYACLHFLTYLGLDQGFAFDYIGEDIAKRPYITVGFTGFVLLIPLALTSTKGWIRRLGKRWTVLHRLVYVTATLGVIHYYWSVKADVRDPLRFAAVLAVLFALRLSFLFQRRRASREARAPRVRQPVGEGAG